METLEKAIISKIGQSGSSSYPKRRFEGKDADSLFTRIGFDKSTQNTMRIGVQLKNAAFYMNCKPVTINEETSFGFDKFAGVKIVNNFTGAYHVLIAAQ